MQKRILAAMCLTLTPFIVEAAEQIGRDNTTAAAMMSGTGTKYNADADMQTVLDALGALNGKPIETLDPAEAR